MIINVDSLLHLVKKNLKYISFLGSNAQKREQEDPCKIKARVVGDATYCDRYWYTENFDSIYIKIKYFNVRLKFVGNALITNPNYTIVQMA